MTIEAKLDKTNELLQAILTAMASGAAIAPTADKKTATPAEKKATPPAETKAEVKAEPEKKATPPAETKAAEVSFDDVIKVIVEINKSTKPGHGRDGVLAVLKKFGCEGKKVPDLKEMGMNAEILAFAKAMLSGEQPAGGGDDLGI